MPEECQTIPMTQPNAWNQKGSLRRDSSFDWPYLCRTASAMPVPSCVVPHTWCFRVTVGAPLLLNEEYPSVLHPYRHGFQLGTQFEIKRHLTLGLRLMSRALAFQARLFLAA